VNASRGADSAAELKALHEELAALTYAVSHDLRAPIRAIEGFSEALLDEYRAKLQGDGVEYLERIRAAALRLEVLIACLVELARVSREPMQIEPVNVSEIATTIAASLDAKGSRPVEWSIEPDLVVDGDRRLLTLALQHLLGNAWKFTRKNPTAHISVGREVQDGARVIVVRDDGAGFDPAFASRLFTPFHRLHPAKEFEGNGIGLAIVRRIVNRHSGEIYAIGKIGEGATFFLDLG